MQQRLAVAEYNASGEDGQTLDEYALILLLVAATAALALTASGGGWSVALAQVAATA